MWSLRRLPVSLFSVAFLLLFSGSAGSAINVPEQSSSFLASRSSTAGVPPPPPHQQISAGAGRGVPGDVEEQTTLCPICSEQDLSDAGRRASGILSGRCTVCNNRFCLACLARFGSSLRASAEAADPFNGSLTAVDRCPLCRAEWTNLEPFLRGRMSPGLPATAPFFEARAARPPRPHSPIGRRAPGASSDGGVRQMLAARDPCLDVLGAGDPCCLFCFGGGLRAVDGPDFVERDRTFERGETSIPSGGGASPVFHILPSRDFFRHRLGCSNSCLWRCWLCTDLCCPYDRVVCESRSSPGGRPPSSRENEREQVVIPPPSQMQMAPEPLAPSGTVEGAAGTAEATGAPQVPPSSGRSSPPEREREERRGERRGDDDASPSWCEKCCCVDHFCGIKRVFGENDFEDEISGMWDEWLRVERLQLERQLSSRSRVRVPAQQSMAVSSSSSSHRPGSSANENDPHDSVGANNYSPLIPVPQPYLRAEAALASLSTDHHLRTVPARSDHASDRTYAPTNIQTARSEEASDQLYFVPRRTHPRLRTRSHLILDFRRPQQRIATCCSLCSCCLTIASLATCCCPTQCAPLLAPAARTLGAGPVLKILSGCTPFSGCMIATSACSLNAVAWKGLVDCDWSEVRAQRSRISDRAMDARMAALLAGARRADAWEAWEREVVGPGGAPRTGTEVGGPERRIGRLED